MLVELLALAAVAQAIPATEPANPWVIEKRLNNGLGKTPAMGWNGWNQGQCNAASASTALNTARAFISLGLKDLGYTYINLDDCWSTNSRNSSGYLVPDPKKFPNGMKAVVDEIHGMGLKFGLYGSAGTRTCAGYPAQEGYETKDAQTLAAWGVDYWKYDNCYTPCNTNPVPQTCGSPRGNSQTWYIKMRDALLATNKPIFYSLCNWGRDSVWTWGANVGNSWRTSTDNWNDWASVQRIVAAVPSFYQYAGPGGFNDLDMMQIGNGKLNDAQERMHFGLWCICKSPILMGTDMTKLSTTRLNLIKNKGLIAINQDPLGKSATIFRPPNSPNPVNGQVYRYWAGPLSDGVVVGLYFPTAETLTVNLANVPGLGSGTYAWTELFSGRTGSGTSISASLGANDLAVFKIKTGSSPPPTSPPTTPPSTPPTTPPSNPPPPPPPPPPPSGCSALYGQCGGLNWSGAKCCSQGTCKFSNDWYSQCL